MTENSSTEDKLWDIFRNATLEEFSDIQEEENSIYFIFRNIPMRIIIQETWEGGTNTSLWVGNVHINIGGISDLLEKLRYKKYGIKDSEELLDKLCKYVAPEEESCPEPFDAPRDYRAGKPLTGGELNE